MRGGSDEGGREMRGLGEEMREGACDEGQGLSQVVSGALTGEVVECLYMRIHVLMCIPVHVHPRRRRGCPRRARDRRYIGDHI